MANHPKIELKNVSKSFGETQVLKSVNLSIEAGEFIVFVGPSGCGKSTLLRMISGLEDLSEGELRISGKSVANVPAAKRGLAMVFQSYALYPHMSVYRNIAFPLKMAGMDGRTIDNKVKEVASILNLSEYLRRKPGQLSGGQRQRVAIGRAIVRQPVAFLFDEPLSNLDAALRVSMRVEISELHEKLRTTMIYVTHDQVEAMTMANRIVVMNGGVIEQVGTPSQLYNTPSNAFVAAFIGSPKMNLLRGARAAKLKAHTIGVRPEHLAISFSKGMWKGKTGVCENLGSDTFLHIHLDDGEDIVARLSGEQDVAYGKKVYVSANLKKLHRFDEEGKTIMARTPAKKAVKKSSAKKT